MSIQIDNCPPFTNYGSDSSITLVNPFVETSTFGMFTKRIPTGVTRYEIMFKIIDGMLSSNQLWFSPFNSTGVSVGLQKPSIFQFQIIGSDIAPLTLVGLLQLIEYTTIITGAIEFKFVFTGTLPIGMPLSPTPSLIQPSLDIHQADSVDESETESLSLSYSPSPTYSYSPEISESETESPEVSGSMEILPEPTIEVPPRMRLPKKPFTVPPAKKPEEPKEPPPKRKVTFQ